MAVSWSGGLSTVAVRQYEAEFLLACQQMERKFAGKIQEVRGVVGSAYYTKVANNIVLHDRGAYHSTVPYTEPEFREVTITPQRKVANIPSDLFEQALVNSSEIAIEARNAVAALNRMQDQIVYNALRTSSADMQDIDATSNLNVDILAEGKSLLGMKNVPDSDIFFVGTYLEQNSLLADATATSADYNSTKVLTNGNISSYVGTQFIWFGEMPEGGLYLNGAIRDCFMFHKDAVRACWWIDPSVVISKQDPQFTTLVLPSVMMGAGVIDPDKAVYIKCTES